MIDSLFHILPALQQRRADSLIGWRQGKPVPLDCFLPRVASWHALVAAQSGQHCALYLEDSLDFAAALLACWQAGKSVWLSADTLAPSCMALADKVDFFIGAFPPQYQSLQIDADDGPWPQAAATACAPGGVAQDIASAAGGSVAAPAIVVHTSGTTGSAQAIPKQLAQLAAEVATLEAVFGPRLPANGGIAVIATVSHQHIYGLLFKVLWPLAAARPIHAHSESYPEPLAQLMAQQPCVLVTSPAHLKRLPAHLAWPQANLRAVFSSGGPLPAEVAQASGQLLGQVAIEVYGSSETGGIAWRQRPLSTTLPQDPAQPQQHAADSNPLPPPDTPWQALPGVAWRIDPATQQLEVCSPHLPDANWMQLADRARVADATHFLLLGRLDRIIKIEEKRISLDAIEALLCTSPLVQQARILVCDATLAEPLSASPSLRQQLAAFVVPSASGQQQLALLGKLAFNRILRQLLQNQIEAVALPRRWRYLSELPENAQGKTTHALLQAMLSERPRLPQMRELARLERASEAGADDEAAPVLERVTLEIIVPPDLLYLEGHFPQAPILPGVVQVDWALHYGRKYFRLNGDFCAMHALKFQYVIRPDCAVTLELHHDLARSCLNFRYYSAAGQHASGRLLFSAPPEPVST
jgi:acyl-coenzyme A synthetase/AMP-(fatty) acid ligase/3-hydroxymyristoyl/3-hydroxydecanoyl-(acyl carrier protein) dehydratase